MSKKTLLVTIIITALIFFALGYLIKGAKVNPIGQSVKGANTFQAGWDAARTRLVDSGFIMPSGVNREIKTVTGEIKEINGDKITLKIRPIEPLADESLDTRIIVVDSATKIYSLEVKDQAKYFAEMTAYANKKPEKNPVTPPSRFDKSEISLTDLKVGQVISATAENDIKTIKEFTALEIDYTKLVVPTPPAVPAAASTTQPVK